MTNPIVAKISRKIRKYREKREWKRRQSEFAHHAVAKEFDWDWKAMPQKRMDVVQHLVRTVAGDRTRYLEIGCFNDDLFNTVNAAVKVGVDPESGGTHRTTSDDFFAGNHDQFDVIFIDGLHEYEQVRRDAINALACLAPGGVIAFHDFLPRNWKEQHVPRLQSTWTGDCWKAAYELSRSEGVDFRIIRIDHGVGVMRKTSENPVVIDLRPELSDSQFDYFCNIVDDLPVIDWAGFQAWSSRPAA